MFVSVPFLLATFILYAGIPELRNAHGSSMMNYVGALSIGYLFLAINNVIDIDCGHSNNCRSNNYCTISGFIIYFALVASFLWLNSMCFDIFWTFRLAQTQFF